jgi:hypothetical protein
MQDSEGQIGLLITVMETAIKLRAECQALDLMHRATVLLTHPTKAIRAQASLMYNAYLAEDPQDSAITCTTLKSSLLEECRSECACFAFLLIPTKEQADQQ